MRNKIQDTLLNHEVAPPETVWQKIAGELDDAGQGMTFPQTLRSLSIDPPLDTWEGISQQLDEDAAGGKVAEKLYTAEIFPPVTAWQKIQQELEHSHEAVLPQQRRRSPFWKYAVAAMIIGFGGYALWQFLPFRQKDTATAVSGIVTDIEATSHTQAGIEAARLHEAESLPKNDAEARNDAALEASKKTYARLEWNAAPDAAAFSYADYMNPDEMSEEGHSGFSEAVSTTGSHEDRYIVLMTPDGHFIRMSKKLSNLVCCVTGEEADKNCETQLEKWKKQMACSDASHPGNFMDILSLVNSLQNQ